MRWFWTLGLSATTAFGTSLLSNAAAEMLQSPVRLIGSFVMLRLAHNPGIAWSLRLPDGVQTTVIVLAVLFVCIAALRDRRRSLLPALAYGLLLGGAIANLWDRIPDGVVTDYISVGTFPIFNVADSWICIGVGMLAMERR